MTIAFPLLQALILGAVASLVWGLIDGGLGGRPFVARWLALALIAWAGLVGPLVVG